MLTLTIRNVAADMLPAAIGQLLDGWAKLRKRRAWQRHIVGYARSLEVTLGRGNSYHPHLHILLLFRRGYAKDISQRDFCEMWRGALGVDYTPVCDVRRAYQREDTPGGGSWERTLGAVLECTKYALSGKVSARAAADELAIIGKALHGRRLIAYGGSLADARAALGLREEDAAADVAETVLECPKCGSQAVTAIALEWATGAGRYLMGYAHHCD